MNLRNLTNQNHIKGCVLLERVSAFPTLQNMKRQIHLNFMLQRIGDTVNHVPWTMDFMRILVSHSTDRLPWMAQALWMVTKLDIETTIRAVSELVLTDPGVSRETRRIRASVMDRLGQIFMEHGDPEIAVTELRQEMIRAGQKATDAMAKNNHGWAFVTVILYQVSWFSNCLAYGSLYMLSYN